ncbi:hypothetical protein BT69DRAFT_1276429 [Atractiella rhizophila]|nr:hypothetical protein BT69DRAFT_1276429 [Atractiella rhizophila]
MHLQSIRLRVIYRNFCAIRATHTSATTDSPLASNASTSSPTKKSPYANKSGITRRRGYWTTLLPTKNFIPPQNQKYYDWFHSSLWQPKNGLNLWAKRFVIQPFLGTADIPVDLPPGFPKIAIDWGNFENLIGAYGFFNIESSPLRLVVDASPWPLNDPLTRQIRIQNISAPLPPVAVRNQFPYLSEPEKLIIGQFKTLPPKLTGRVYASWTCKDNGEVLAAVRQGPVGEKQREVWRVHGKAEYDEVMAEIYKRLGLETVDREQDLADKETVMKRRYTPQSKRDISMHDMLSDLLGNRTHSK